LTAEILISIGPILKYHLIVGIRFYPLIFKKYITRSTLDDL